MFFLVIFRLQRPLSSIFLPSRRRAAQPCSTSASNVFCRLPFHYAADRVMHRFGVRPSVRPSVPSFSPTLIGSGAHTQRDSPGGSTRFAQHTFLSEYYEDGHGCWFLCTSRSHAVHMRCCLADRGLSVCLCAYRWCIVATRRNGLSRCVNFKLILLPAGVCSGVVGGSVFA